MRTLSITPERGMIPAASVTGSVMRSRAEAEGMPRTSLYSARRPLSLPARTNIKTHAATSPKVTESKAIHTALYTFSRNV